jgi:type IV pilus assembly protein PilY1
MKKIILLSAIFLAQLSLADDTEIYGTDGVDEDNQVNANVLFIMDTSGSMGGTVALSNAAFSSSGDYSLGDYDESKVYNDLYDDKDDGHLLTAISQNTATNNCADELAVLLSTGEVYDRFQQYRQKDNGSGTTKWRNSLLDGDDGAIRCDTNNDGLSGQGSANTIYTGKYMNWYNFYKTAANSTRMKVVVDVVKGLTHSLSDVNLGLMRFDRYGQGGLIDVPVTDIATSGPLIRAKLDSYVPNGGTPLEESMYEAMRYYRGDTWEYGDTSYPNASVASSRDSSNTNKYKTPIEATCQKNHIILLTDGEPTGDTSSNDEIRSLISNTDFPGGFSKSCSGNGQCMDELAYWMKNNDQNSSLINTQDISTYTIGGFGLVNGVDLLQRTADAGEGTYFAADSTDGLTIALESIFLRILDANTTFTAPAVSVNSFNTSEHRDELFYALFRPSDNVKWAGNLKKYKITSQGIVIGQPKSDGTEVAAVNSETGFFSESAKDFFNDSDKVDGSNVALGGFANLLNPDGRKVYTETTATSEVLGELKNHHSIESLGAINDDERQELINWTYGQDTKKGVTSSRFEIGDPLHSEPVIVTYGGTEESPDSSIFFGTNEGFIHGLSTETGEEQFAFLPQALHQTQKTYYEDEIAASSKPYGMDGAITTWFYDKNNDNIILNGSTAQADEHVHLYAGMRRGGRNYYAFDITNRTSPSMLFKIEGGVTTGFDKLGQTWSQMQIAKVKYNGQDRFVLFFTGGYDTNQDSNATAEADTIGNAVYMVDATTGDLLWSASNSGANKNISSMINSMPASPSLIDHNGDGFVDYFFTADSGGRVFRFDIDQENSGAASFADGGLIASIAGSDTSSNRRFYNKTNVGLVKDKQYGDYLTIAIGSGHRAHPKNTTLVENRFYIIKDHSPYEKPDNYSTTTEAATTKISLNTDESPDPLKLYNATSIMEGGLEALEANDDLRKMLNMGGGWYVTLRSGGEKVLAESLTTNGTIIFTTFKPLSSSSSTDTCGANTGESRVYALDLNYGLGLLDLDGDGEAEAYINIETPGIPPRPVVIKPPSGDDGESKEIIAVGTVTLDPENTDGENKEVTPIYWRQNDNN